MRIIGHSLRSSSPIRSHRYLVVLLGFVRGKPDGQLFTQELHKPPEIYAAQPRTSM